MNPVGSVPTYAKVTPPRDARVGPDQPTAAPRHTVEAPSGVEPSLFEVLTPEEREFFTQQAKLGPLTYLPTGNRQSPGAAPIGQRIDVRG